jgi:poly(hydroxyalkanoate) granule-associated protein
MKASKRNTQVKALENLKSLAIAQVEAARDAVVDRAGEARARTVEMVTQLEKVFEQRVSKAIGRLGVPSAKEVRALSRQVSELKVSVEKLRRARARA